MDLEKKVDLILVELKNVCNQIDKDRREHQTIYSHEFTRLNDLIAKNSIRISNLEQ